MTRTRKQNSLLADILEWMLAPLMLLWLMSVGLTWLSAQGIARPPYERELADMTRALAAQVSEQQAQGAATAQPEVLAHSLEGLRASASGGYWYQVLGPQGEHLAGDRGLQAPPRAQEKDAGTVSFRDDVLGDKSVRVAAMWVSAANGSDQPRALVQVAETLDKRSMLATEILRGVVLPQLVFLPLGVLLIWLALARSIGPLNELQQRIRRRDTNDLSPIDERGVPEEVSSLVRAINDLLMRLDQSIATQKHFLADAAHQLKTPLAGLRMQAELAQREIDAGTGDAQTITRSLRNIALSSQRAAHMVNQLLSMARTDEQQAPLVLAPVDLAELAVELMPDFVPRALDKRIDFGYEGAGPGEAPMIQGHRLLLGEMLRNLIDNALQCTPAGGTVTVRVAEQDQQVVLQVEDSGPGIPPAEREMVFRPFYRVLGTPVDGSGLGLAIVREVAARHQASVGLEDANLHHRDGMGEHADAAFGPGVRFTLRFDTPNGQPGSAQL
jgi:two-component system sensor histidine kinase TctE